MTVFKDRMRDLTTYPVLFMYNMKQTIKCRLIYNTAGMNDSETVAVRVKFVNNPLKTTIPALVVKQVGFEVYRHTFCCRIYKDVRG